MKIQLALVLLIGALATPDWALAKAEVPVDRLPEETLTAGDELVLPDGSEPLSAEVTEIVTEESIPLPPVDDRPRKRRAANKTEPFKMKIVNDFVSEWAAFWRLSGYNPTGNSPSSGAVLSNVGLRYKVPDKHGEYYQIAYEVGYNLWEAGTTDIRMLELDIEVFAAGSPVFRLEHHPYYGVGFGNAEVRRRGLGTFSQNVVTVFGGIEFPGRRVDFDVFAKYIYGPDNRYNMDDLQLGLGVVYTFGRGR